MNEAVVGYRVRVYDLGKEAPWNAAALVLYEQDFRERAEDPNGWRLGMALRRAEMNARHMEELWPENYVEVDCIWETTATMPGKERP